MKRIVLFLASLAAFPVLAQTPVSPTPNCVISATFTAAGRSPAYNNLVPVGAIGTGCTTWTLTYASTGFSVVSIELDEAPDSSGAPGTWTVFPSTLSGVLPLTATTFGQVTAFKFYPWVSINVNTATGTGTITATAYGWRPGPTSDANSTQTVVAGTSTPADATSNTAVPGFQNYGLLFNGTTWDRTRSASLAVYPAATTLTARNAIGANIIEKGSRWAVISNPAVSTQATASLAAEAAVRHVADCVSFSGGSTTAPALTALTINLRDGATGAGTIIWTHEVIVGAATGQNVPSFTACGLNLVGTTNTAMTLEYSALLTNLIESVSISGFNVN